MKMGKKLTLSDVEHAQIMALHKEGYSEDGSISERVKRSKNAVHNAVVHEIPEIRDLFWCQKVCSPIKNHTKGWPCH